MGVIFTKLWTILGAGNVFVKGKGGSLEGWIWRVLSESRQARRTRRTRKEAGFGKIYKHSAPLGLGCEGFASFYKHSAPLGLGCEGVAFFYKHSAPLGLRFRAFESIFYKLSLCEQL